MKRDGSLTRGGREQQKVLVSSVAGLQMKRNAPNFALAHMIQDIVNTCYFLRSVYDQDRQKYLDWVLSALTSLGYPTKDLDFSVNFGDKFQLLDFNISDKRTKSGEIAFFTINLEVDNEVWSRKDSKQIPVDVFSIKFIK